jgi:hypothetical protein
MQQNSCEADSLQASQALYGNGLWFMLHYLIDHTFCSSVSNSVKYNTNFFVTHSTSVVY